VSTSDERLAQEHPLKSPDRSTPPTCGLVRRGRTCAVIGFGIAGGCAGVSAAAAGARVLVLEAPRGGRHT